MSVDLPHLQRWLGRTEARTDLIAPGPAQGLDALLDHDGAEPRAGDSLAPGGHWLYALEPLARQSLLGPDGHPRRGGFMPPVTLPRRMWAGSRIEFHKPLIVGGSLQRSSAIVGVSGKQGRSGDLVFVRVRHEFCHGATIALVEEQDIVYRDQARPADPVPATVVVAAAAAGVAAEVVAEVAEEVASPNHDFARTIHPDATLLFRYSALTRNGHRIHYDRRWATEVEGYPGLVVHGPLIATLLLDLLRRNLPDAAIASFTFRALAPLFDTAPFEVFGRISDDGRSVRLWARGPDGAMAMEATAVLGRVQRHASPQPDNAPCSSPQSAPQSPPEATPC